MTSHRLERARIALDYSTGRREYAPRPHGATPVNHPRIQGWVGVQRARVVLARRVYALLSPGHGEVPGRILIPAVQKSVKNYQKTLKKQEKTFVFDSKTFSFGAKSAKNLLKKAGLEAVLRVGPGGLEAFWVRSRPRLDLLNSTQNLLRRIETNRKTSSEVVEGWDDYERAVFAENLVKRSNARGLNQT